MTDQPTPRTTKSTEARPDASRLSLPHLGALDGLRALAVIAVIAYHGAPDTIPGGFFGVELFFVVSGYLITTLLLNEFRNEGYLNARQFWGRRFRRLLPSVLVLLASVTLWSAIAAPDLLDQLRAEVAASAAYVANWFFIFNNESYFESFGRPSPLRHLWSLAIEEQFYIVWPVVVGLCLKHGGIRRLRYAALGIGTLSAVWMILLYEPWTDPSRVYYGTDTRLFGILLGAALACSWRPWERRPLPERGVAVVNSAGIAGLAALALLTIAGSDWEPWVYQGGMVVVSVSSALAIAASTTPQTQIAQLLANPRLQAIGRRSYALYLWNWPVVVFTRPGIDVPFDGITLFVFRLALTVALAETSYRLIENPYRLRVPLKVVLSRPLAGTIGVLSAVVIAAVVVIGTPTESPNLGQAAALSASLDPTATTTTAAAAQQTGVATRDADGSPAATVAGVAQTAAPPAAAGGDEPGVAAGPDTGAPPQAAQTTGPRIAVIGDSVTLGASVEIQEYFGPRVVVDALESRQMTQLAERFALLGDTIDTVVVHLGTNGAFKASTLREALTTLDDSVQVFLINTSSSQPWEGRVNDAIDDVVAADPSVHVIDFRSAAQADWFVDDGVHLTRTGQAGYVQLIASNVG